MTVKQFREARLVDDHFVVSVDEHKTAANYGAAKLVLSCTLHSWLNIFASNIRPQILNMTDVKPEMFLSWNGKSLASSQITRSVVTKWQKAGLGTGLTFNIVRKTAVTTMHSVHPDMNDLLADLMCHRVQTANKCYRVVERERTSVAASEKLVAAIAQCPSVPGSQTSVTSVCEQVSQATSDTDTDIVDPSTTASAKDIFSSDDVRMIMQLCSHSGPVSDARITEALNKSSTGCDLLERFDVFQLKNRIKYECRKMHKC